MRTRVILIWFGALAGAPQVLSQAEARTTVQSVLCGGLKVKSDAIARIAERVTT